MDGTRKENKNMANKNTKKNEVVKNEAKNEVVKNEAKTEVVKIDAKAVETVVKRIATKIGSIEKGYLSIAGDVARLRDMTAWKETGHKNIYELCADKFGMARGTVSNLCSIYDRFGDGNYKLGEEADGKKLTELLKQIYDEKHPELEASFDGESESGDGETSDTKKKKVFSFDYTTLEKTDISDVFADIKDAFAGFLNGDEVPENYTFEIVVKR